MRRARRTESRGSVRLLTGGRRVGASTWFSSRGGAVQQTYPRPPRATCAPRRGCTRSTGPSEWCPIGSSRTLLKRTASSPRSPSTCASVPTHERHNNHGDENQDNRDDDQKLREIAGVRRDGIRTTQDHFAKPSASLERDQRLPSRRRAASHAGDRELRSVPRATRSAPAKFREHLGRSGT